MKKTLLLSKTIIILIFIVPYAFTENIENTYKNLYIDQMNGNNSSSTTGTEADPFKSITYAILKNRNTNEPLFVHIKAGTYDANPNKPPNEREIFPIELTNGITIQGDDGAENCIISGAFNSNSKASILRGTNVLNILIKDLTLRDMILSEGQGAACVFNSCSGTIENCKFVNNTSTWDGGAFILSVTKDLKFNIFSNHFSNNLAHAGGGAFMIYGDFQGNIQNNIFTSNRTEKYQGGGFATYHDAYSCFKGNIIGNSFIGNTANHNGGGFWIEHDFVGDISHNTFTGNTSKTYRGGAFCVIGNLTGDIYNNSFNNNSANSRGGGAFYANSSVIGSIFSNTFFNNISKSGHGGAFYIHNKLTGNIEKNIFNLNTAKNYGGGGFYINDMKGSISDNSFNENSCEYNYGGGFYIESDFIGDINENMFSRNSANEYEAGAFCVSSNMTGDIINNTFVENSGKQGKAFRISGFLMGRIDSNIFSQYNSFYIAKNNDPIVVSNNYFLYIRNISSQQNLFVFNNSFINSGVNIWNSANKSEISNNIFFKSSNAIWLEGELNLLIKHNNFYNTTNILHRNNQAMGADSFFIEMLMPNTFINNKDFLPEFVGEDLETGIWTKNLIYDAENNFTIFTDTSKNWQNGRWIGSMINLSNSLTERRQHYMIADNTTTQIKVKGYIVSSNIGQQDHIYSIDDYRLNYNSQNIDAGIQNSILYDFEKEWRPQGGYCDIGADEFFKGEMIPGIAHVDPPVKNITANTATLQAQINPNELSSTCYFEFGTDITYGLTTSVLSGYTGSELFLINSDINGLSPNTEYHFRLIATNSTGTAYGNDQFFKTKSNTANLNGKVSLAIAGHSGLVVKNANIKLEGTDYETTTNELGEFIIKDIPASNYKLIISADNLIPIEYQVNLSEGQNFDIGVNEMFVPSSEGIEKTIQNAVTTERKRWDSNGDNKKGIPEAIDALQDVVGIK